jgi:hypothetical protein
MSKLQEAAALLQYYIDENIPSQETIGAQDLVDAILSADEEINELHNRLEELQWAMNHI